MTVELAFAKILKTLRINNMLSQEELAFRSDLDRTYISMLERSIHQPTISTIFALSRALNIKASEMIKLVEIDCENDIESNQKN
ncbi:helix-turn-helix domain-containing protein [Paenibacillus alginolyticus]|uniref:helix-turn-helix domain-containing protein n=1 Tax=Paenibacillus alginolyticus TaxID=59839 RepID=UPI0003F644B9|nr:helix-turn-helix transcriptional regulator [Paenibacillus alginolyticus]MCY9663710.1 helix-turn-helix domain-containing protein [Paenibacillus alginolyticus]